MSRPNGERTDATDQDADDASPPEDADAEWFDRHARVECRSSDRWVRADPPSDDWHDRHHRTKRRN